jgi:glycine/D-amino acid oxidase-like deaminating enzyme
VTGSASIVGAGIFGASLAYRLARDGWDTTLYERHEPGHPGAASGGESRLIRYAHGSNAWYTRSAWRARELWRELEARTGRELLVESGVAWFARSDSGWEAESERVLHAEGIPAERLDPESARELFPSFEPGDLRFVLWEPSAGVLRACEATRATVEAGERAGVRLVRETAVPGSVEADVVVWACGAWLPGLFELPVRVTKQDIAFFSAGGWTTPPVPAWVDYDRAVYGLGDLDGVGVKVAPDAEGPPFDPEHGERVASAETARSARAYLTERFPALGDAPLSRATVCQYALTPDTNFIVAPRPGHEREWILGGGSGHGFKHGPALAEYAARVITGQEAPGAEFGLGPRQQKQSLRTAGTT